MINSIRSIDLSKFGSKDQPIVERSVTEATPRELNLPKSKPAPVKPETGSQENVALTPKAELPKMNQLEHLLFISLKIKL